MSKDPAILWYVDDWIGGTLLMTRHHKGAYMDVLMAQVNNGHMALHEIKTLLGPQDENIWETVLRKKFIQDSEGKYYNKKLEDVINKRRAYTESRRNNLKKGASHKGEHMGDDMEPHMGNGNGNRNINRNKIGVQGEEKDDPAEGKDPIDFQFIVDSYHHLCPKMNKVVVINKLREGLMNARVGEYGKQKVIEVLRLAGESNFLNGINDKAWKADFEWIMRPQNFVKVMEGKYKNNGSSISTIHGIPQREREYKPEQTF
jgi:uncharacterized protein YdaU (DUF1376 family)